MQKIQVYRAALRRSGVLRVADSETHCGAQAASVLHAFLQDAPAERVVVIYLNGKNAIIGLELVAMGGLHGCAVTPSEVFRGAIVAGATAIIIGHNHPSGDPKPSTEDVKMTLDVALAGETIGIRVLDHLVVTRDAGKWESIRDRHPEVFRD
jgi:DNA repair protein RadC